MILPETKVIIHKAVELEQKNAPKPRSNHELYSLMIEDYEQVIDEIKTFNLQKKAMWLEIKKKETRSYNLTVDNMKTTLRHLIAESLQLAALLEGVQTDED